MANLNPRISIIFPLYNGEKFLNRNLDSIKNLSNIEDIELVIVDNNSNDSSVKIVQSYKDIINIKLIHNKANLGFSKACNIGANNSNGQFIFVTNQDVIFPVDFFEKLMKLYTMYKNDSEIIFSPAVVFEGNGIHYFGAKIHFLGFSYTPELRHKLPPKKIVKLTQRITGCTLFIKKELFLQMGGFDINFFMYCEDTDFSLRSLRRGLKIYTTNDPYLIHQKHTLAITDFRYYLLERNRILVLIKNIFGFKKIFPMFLISEFILLIQSILMRKFKFRIRIYYELFSNRKFLKKLRKESKDKLALYPFQKLSKTLDPVMIEDLEHLKFFEKFLIIYNSLSKLI